MKKTKIISTIGATALMLGVGINLGYSLNDYGINTHSLSAFVWAQNSTDGGGNKTSDTEYGAEEVSIHVDCILTKTVGGSSGSSSGVSGNISGGINTNIGNLGGGISGNSNNSSSSNSSYTITKEIHANQIMCRETSCTVSVCHSFNPCVW